MSHESESNRPNVYFALGAAATIVLLVSSQVIRSHETLLLKVAGVTAVPLSLLFMFAPFYYLNKFGCVESGKSFVHTTKVVDRGVYAIVRHPQYVGYVLLNLGLALLNWHGVTAVATFLACIFFYLQSIQEERFCQQQMGADYDAYCRRVPRFNFLWGIIKWLNRKRAA
ncbi:MAG: isoprenylcysteine carboxylmethyltransferase family protein [Ardenticatenaceae bacterium]|nr:isoprenylcysteine carboxylmethyltransferase family protein [Ardenticatenaceae bacterium]